MRSAYQRHRLAKFCSDFKASKSVQLRDPRHLAEPASLEGSSVIAFYVGIFVYMRSDSSPAFLKEN